MAQCSMLQMIGSLINCHKYLYGTNLAEHNGILEDLWTIEGLPRLYVKKAMTPILYGSSASPIELWDKHKFEYDFNMLKIIKKEMNEGRFKEAIEFKDFVISSVNPEPTMNVNINNEKFTIHCNKFKWEERDVKEYFVYSQGELRRITREVHRVPDLPSFKRYFLTLLCHNLDSQVANSIGLLSIWVLPNHDSFTVHPNNALKVRIKYRNEMTKIYNNRHFILKNFFRSIGIKETYSDVDHEEVQFSINALK